MRSHSVLLLIALVVIGSTYSFEFTSLQEVKALKSSKYGANLIETISLSLGHGSGSIDGIKDLLNKLISELDHDQAKATAVWRALDQKLATKITLLRKQIKALSKRITFLRHEIVVYKHKIKLAHRNIKQYNEQTKKNNKNIKRIQKKRAQDHAVFVKSQSNHSDVINVVDEVCDQLSELIGSIAGVGKAEHVAATAAEIRDQKASFLQITNGNEEEASILMELATSANQAALKRLIHLLKKIKASANKSMADDVVAEATSKRICHDLISALHKDNQRLASALKQQTANLHKYEIHLANYQHELKEKISERKLKRKELKLTIKQRREAKAAYLKEKKERAEDKTCVIKLRRIFLAKIANMSKMLKLKIGNF